MTSFVDFHDEISALRSAAASVDLGGMPPDSEVGGLVSISPPSNVKIDQISGENVTVLGSGVDTLVLALDVSWQWPIMLDVLRETKAEAKASKEQKGFEWPKTETDDTWGAAFDMQPFGVGGYEWVLIGHEFTFRVGDWLTPGSRPSVMVEVRSETLWRLGVAACVERVSNLIMGLGGNVERCRVSRLDLCVDLRIKSPLWSPSLLEHCVSRSRKRSVYLDTRDLEGISVGRGVVQCRVYDKLREIREVSHKFWFGDVWKINLDEVCDDERIVRVEYQLRREALKEMGIDLIGDLETKSAAVWGYCSQEWLRFVDDADQHHTMQTVAPWWLVVQTAYKGSQLGTSAVRARACHSDEKQLLQQMFGLASAVAALRDQDKLWYTTGPLFWFKEAQRLAEEQGIGGRVSFAVKVREKRARYFRYVESMPDVVDTAPRFFSYGSGDLDEMTEEEWEASHM